jgi:hypothetical protein
MDIVGGQQSEAMFAGERIERGDPGNVIAAVEIAGSEVVQGWQAVDKPGDKCGKREGYSVA